MKNGSIYLVLRPIVPQEEKRISSPQIKMDWNDNATRNIYDIEEYKEKVRFGLGKGQGLLNWYIALAQGHTNEQGYIFQE